MTTGPENAAIVAFILIGGFIATAGWTVFELWRENRRVKQAKLRRRQALKKLFSECHTSDSRKHRMVLLKVVRQEGSTTKYHFGCVYCGIRCECEKQQTKLLR